MNSRRHASSVAATSAFGTRQARKRGQERHPARLGVSIAAGYDRRQLPFGSALAWRRSARQQGATPEEQFGALDKQAQRALDGSQEVRLTSQDRYSDVRIEAFLSSLRATVELLEERIHSEEELSGLRDPLDRSYPVAVRTLRDRLGSLVATLAKVETGLAAHSG